jgi:gamma-glutamyltranspeptidase/glutathione hydrolase
MTLRTIERHDVAAMGAYSADAVHLIAEAYRLAYADRAQYMADADFVDVPLDGLLDDGYVAQRAAAIDLQRSMGAPAHGRPPGCCAQPRAAAALSPEAGTSHLSIVDAQGNAVALTTTIESGFGSHLMVRGFFLNNQLTDFSFVPAGANGEPVANRVEPGKRPRSSMTPVLVFDPQHQLDAVIGSPGGSAIIQYVTKTIVGLYDWKLDAQQAVALGNFGAQTSAVTQLERGTAVAPLSGPLRSRGHTVALVEFASGLHAIRRANEVRSGYWGAAIDTAAGWTAGADPRRDGVAMGF